MMGFSISRLFCLKTVYTIFIIFLFIFSGLLITANPAAMARFQFYLFN